MPSETEESVDRALDRKKLLRLPRGFKPTHLVFPLACRLVRDFRSIVAPVLLAMAHTWEELAARSPITPQVLSQQQTRRILQAF